MQWKDYSYLKNRHAVLAPSNPSWTNYDDEKLISVYENNQKKIEGTELHAWAEEVVSSIHLTKELVAFRSKRLFKIDIDEIRKLGEQNPLVRNSRAKETVYMYINDAVKFDMIAEQPLAYDNKFCFGTADAIQFDGQLLRIHDLKTGETPAHMDQLIKYAALFCLDYGWDPVLLMFELRIYQIDQVMIYKPTSEEVQNMMDTIVHMVSVLRQYEVQRGDL